MPPRTPLPVYGKDPGFDFTPVDREGILMLAVEEDGWPAALGVSRLFEGPFDIDAMQEAWLEAQAPRPSLTSHAAVVGPRTAEEVVWRHIGAPQEMEVVDRRAEGEPGSDVYNWLADLDLNSDPWFPDLTVEYPVKARVTSLSDNCHVLTRWLHHTAGDAAFIGALEQDLLGGYHQKVTGSLPAWAQVPVLHSMLNRSPKADLAAKGESKGWLTFLRDEYRAGREALREGVDQIAGSPGSPGPITATAMIPDQSTITGLRDSARSLGATVTDVALAAATQAVAEWNQSFGLQPTYQRHGVPVSLRGMGDSSTSAQGNAVTMYQVSCRRDEWEDPGALATRLANVRRQFMEDDLVKRLKADGLLKRVGARMPVRTRLSRIAKANTPRTLILTNAGITFPEIIDGKLTGRSAVMEAGGAQITATVGGGNANPMCPNLVAISTTHDGMMVTHMGNRATCTVDELREVTKLIVAKLSAFAD